MGSGVGGASSGHPSRGLSFSTMVWTSIAFPLLGLCFGCQYTTYGCRSCIGLPSSMLSWAVVPVHLPLLGFSVVFGWGRPMRCEAPNSILVTKIWMVGVRRHRWRSTSSGLDSNRRRRRLPRGPQALQCNFDFLQRSLCKWGDVKLLL
ncbi:hypothetical protein BS78_01G359800 [Paspalum vaginatum]|nr:hypothetical protein BS78_01G359800 [Paspalum vaginatum]